MNHTSETFVFGKGAPAVELSPGITRKILAYSDALMICEFRMAKGSVLKDHHHPHHQSSTVVSGVLRYTVGSETRLVGAGDSVMIGPEVPHSALVEEDARVIDAFSPIREDFL